MAAPLNPEFQAYLESIANKYQHWCNRYTLTDAEDRQQKQNQFSPFDFGLMVQTLQPKQSPGTSCEEKTEEREILPVLNGVRKYADDHVLLVGRPGSGKSTALARLLWEEAEKLRSPLKSAARQIIPVLIELRYLQTSSVIERIQAFLQQHDPNLNLDEATLKSLLRQSRFLLLIDGLNELPSEDARQQVATFRRDYPQTPMIFTTRDLGVGGDLGIDKKLEMQPLTETQMREFVLAYLPTQGEQMLQQLKGRLREFGQTPLLLWMLCGLFQQTKTIPPNLGLVFCLFTQGYEQNLRGDVPVAADSRSWWPQLLQYLAFMMMQGEPPTEFRVAISKKEAEDILTEFLEREKFDKPRDYAKRWLEDLLKHHLIQIASNSQIEFRHQLIQEYYAAEYLLQQLPRLSDAKLKRDYLNYLKWTEPIALMLALVEDEAKVLQLVQLALDVDLMLGARLAGEVKRDFQEKTINFITKLNIPELLNIELLGITRSECAVEFLSNILNHQDEYLRRRAAQALGTIGNEVAVNALIQALHNKYSVVRWIATEQLGIIASKTPLTALIQALNDEDSNVRQNVAYALGKIGDKIAVSPLIQKLNDKFYTVRSSAIYTLSKIRDKIAINAIVNAIDHEYSDVRKGAIEALGRIGDEAAINKLIHAVNHEYSDVRRSAIQVLGKIGDEEIINTLLLALNDEDSNVRESAIETLGKIGSQKTIVALIQSLNDKDSNVRKSAIETLGKMGNQVAVSSLIQALKDEGSNVRSAAAYALGEIGNEVAVSSLIQALKDQNFNVRSTAIYALGKIGNESIINFLKKNISNEYSDILWSLASALERIDSTTVMDSLIQGFNHEDYYVRWECIYTLSKVGNEVAEKLLNIALNNKYPDVRISAAEVLVNMGSKRVDKFLIQALKDEDFNVRWRAADALGRMGKDSAVNPLVQALKDKDFNVRMSVTNALGKIASCQIINYMWQLLANDLYEAKNIILNIQERCKFYNYEIFQSPPFIEESNTDSTPRTQTIIYDQRGANIGNVAHSVYGNQQTLSVTPNEDFPPT